MHARTVLILILFGTFLVSVLFSFHYQISPTVDAKAYTRIARNMVAGHGYIENIENAGSPASDDAIVRVGPGYEFFLAGLYWFTDGQNLTIVWIAQALLRVLTAFFLYRLALLLFGSDGYGITIGLVAAFFIGFMPDLVVVGGMLLAETLFLTLSVVAIYYSILLLREEGNKYINLYAAGCLWGFAALVRPTAAPMVFLLAVILAYRKRWAHAGIVISITLLLLASWSVRNSLVYDKPLFTTTAGSYALWVGNNAGATGGYDKTPQIQRLIATHHSVELSKKAFGDYFAFIVHRPFKFIELQFRKTVLYFSLIRPMGLWIYLSNLPVDRIITLGLSAIATAFLFIFGAGGIYFYFRDTIRKNVYLLGVMALQPLVVIPTYVETRYRYPLYLFLALFAAYSIVSLYRRRDKIASFAKPIFLSLIVFIVITGIDILYSFNSIVEKIRFVINAI